MMTGDLRISSRVNKRRGGFRVGTEALLLTSSDRVSPAQLVAMFDDPDVRVEIAVDDDGTFVVISDEMRGGIRQLADAGLPDFYPLQDELARRRLAASDVLGSIPGRGAGAEHPATHPGAPVAQRLVDSNPALPVAGGTTDLGVPVTAATAIETPTGVVEERAPVSDEAIVEAGLNGAADRQAEVMVDGAPAEQVALTEDIQGLDGSAEQLVPEPRIDSATLAAVDAERMKAGVEDVFSPAADTVEAEGVVAAPSVEAAVGEPVVAAGEAARVADPAPATLVTETPRKTRRHR